MEQIRKRILIIGSKGMAGHVVYRYLKGLKKYHVADISRNNAYFISTYTIVDITDFTALLYVLQTEKPDVVINCIGVLIQEAENNPDRAILINSYLSHFIARKGKELNFKLIHISTDCVFSGKKGGYIETDPLDGIGFYAHTKAMGEITYDNHLTLRTSLVGPELKSNGIGLFHWFIQQNGTVRGYTKAIWTGITTIELAHAIEHAIINNYSGLYHLVNNTRISKFELIHLFREVFEKDNVLIEPYDDYVVDKSLINSNDDFKINTYQQMVNDMRAWMYNNKDLYTGYDLA